MKKLSLTQQFACAAVITAATSTAALASSLPLPTIGPLPPAVDNQIKNVGHCQAYESDGGDSLYAGGSILLKCTPFANIYGPNAQGIPMPPTFGAQAGVPLGPSLPGYLVLYTYSPQVSNLPFGAIWGDPYTVQLATDRVVGTTSDGRKIIREFTLGKPAGFTPIIGEGLVGGGLPVPAPFMPAGTPIVSFKDYTCPTTKPAVLHSKQVTIAGQVFTVGGYACAPASGGIQKISAE